MHCCVIVTLKGSQKVLGPMPNVHTLACKQDALTLCLYKLTVNCLGYKHLPHDLKLLFYTLALHAMCR